MVLSIIICFRLLGVLLSLYCLTSLCFVLLVFCCRLFFIEIIYTADQTIKFENAENFSIERADRLLYNADKNVLYWGEAGYQNCLDYTKMNEEMQAHKEEILKGYEELSTSIRDCFNQ